MVAGLAGSTLANRYDLLELLGTGGMGEVYRARDRELDELVALKVIRTDRADDPDLVQRFRHEVKLARRVTHANVARTFELGYADGVMFCTMELIEGESLTRRLGVARKLGVPEAVAIATAVCDALAAAHAAGVIHRDIKPDNVLLARDGRVVVADFGIAAVGVASGGDLSGTPAYMAPEQTRGEPATPATDVYATGAVLFEMLTGRRGFDGETVAIIDAKQTVERLLPSGVPPLLAEVVARATARDPAQRLASAEALRGALAPWARAVQAPAPAQRQATDPELLELIVLAPRAIDGEERLHLAEAVHEALLAGLARQPRIRVRPRADVPEDTGAAVVALRAGQALALTVTRAGAPVIALELPLAIDAIRGAAEAAVAAIVTALAPGAPVQPQPEALDLLLRARHAVQRDLARTPEAFGLLERANAIAPGDPRITAGLAIAQVRRAFFVQDSEARVLEEAAELARRALAAGPDLAEAHLAMGHVELHTGDAAIAAGHFRRAIACSPHDPEAHEWLGRLLLEAGYLDLALPRLHEAIAIAPQRASALWEIARARALDGDWAAHDQLVGEIATFENVSQRFLGKVRFALWRRNAVQLEGLAANAPAIGFHTLTMPALIAIGEGRWPEVRDRVLAAAQAMSSGDLRRRVFFAQVAAEVAGFADDAEACEHLIVHSVEQGLVDLHWLDRCPLLAAARERPRFAPARAQVKQRAEAILDALYGDHVLQTVAETELAPSTAR